MYYELYGLKPADLTNEQIKKVPTDILWRNINDEPRFAEEFITRHKTLKEVSSHLRYQIDKNEVKVEKVLAFLNQLASQEIDYKILQRYESILNKENMVRTAYAFLKSRDYDLRDDYLSDGFMYEFFKYMCYIDSNDPIFIQLIKKGKNRSTKSMRSYMLNTLAYMSKQSIETVMPELEDCTDGFISNLLHASAHIPEKYHIKILRAIGRKNTIYLHTFVSQSVKTKIHPEVVKKLGVKYRVKALDVLCHSKEYPFTHKISVEKFHELVFPCMFQETNESKILMQTWELWQPRIPTALPEYK